MKNYRAIVKRELDHARNKHPLWPLNRYRQLTIIAEEFGELAQAINDNREDDAEIEAAQTIATLIRFLENK